MSEKNLDTIDEDDKKEDLGHSKDSLSKLLHESLLLKIDIFSKEFEDEREETVIEDSGSQDIEKKDIEIDDEGRENDDAFLLSVEDEIELSDMYKSKKEFNSYMNKFPKKKQKVKIEKTVKADQEDIKAVESKAPKRQSRDSFDLVRKPIKKKVEKVTTDKNNLFDISKMDSKRVKPIKTKEKECLVDIPERQNNSFCMDINKKEKIRKVVKNENRLMCIDFNEEDRMAFKKKDYLKIEVLENE